MCDLLLTSDDDKGSQTVEMLLIIHYKIINHVLFLTIFVTNTFALKLKNIYILYTILYTCYVIIY